MKSKILLLFFLVPLYMLAQPNIQVNGFGHVEYELYHKPDNNEYESAFKLGEHDLFVNGRLNKKLSFLSEVVVRQDSKSSSGYGVSIERVFLKYNYKGQHSLIVGKVHSPLNYWNDVYHHGRLFFPTIDRPQNFDYFMPIHTLGVRAQGQNLGPLNFGYDLQIGNSMESTDFGSEGVNFSYLASAHIKPIENMRLQAGYYHDFLPNNHHGAHSHSGSAHNMSYHDELTTDQFYTSFAYFGEHLEFLNEFAFVVNKTDSLGMAQNLSNYTYLGYKLKDKYVPFVMMDLVQHAPNELHINPVNGLKYSLGFRWEFDPKCNLKIQLERYGPMNRVSNVPGIQNKYEIKLQLAYAI
ncbi:MAG: hypothetical protein LW688_07335 [Cryomorphaceae bacterium]|jgi:hypothetical protein|nr:hypothetical protein [Cryomorphaceae bacterium]